MEIENESYQLEHQEEYEQEFHAVLSQEFITLIARIKRLLKEMDSISKLVKQNESLRAELNYLVIFMFSLLVLNYLMMFLSVGALIHIILRICWT